VDGVFVEVFVAGAGAVDILPCCGVVEAEFVGGDADDWSVFVVAVFYEERDSTS